MFLKVLFLFVALKQLRKAVNLASLNHSFSMTVCFDTQVSKEEDNDAELV